MRNLLAVDTETTLIVDRDVPRLLVISAAWQGGSRVTLVHTEARAASAVASLVEEMDAERRELVFHNATFDLEVLIAAGLSRDVVARWVRAGRVHDTMLLDQLLRLAEGGEGANRTSPYYHKQYDGTLPRRSLKTLAAEFLGIDLEKGDVRLGFASVLETGALTTEQHDYARRDALTTLALGEVLIRRAEVFGPALLSEATQVGASLALSAIGRRGLRLDRAATERAMTSTVEAKDTAAAILRAEGLLVLVGKKTPREKLAEKAVRRRFDAWAAAAGVEVPRTETGKPSLRREDWERYAERDETINAFVEYKKKEKRAGTFLKAWLNASRQTGLVRPNYRPLIATGRTSCANPNLQQIPRRKGSLRELFVADAGTALWELDYATLELVCVAQVCLDELGESRLATAINAGVDVHRMLAAVIHHKPEDQVTKDERFLAKMANFGFWGGMGWRKFVEHCWTLARLSISEDQAKTVRAAWLEAFPEAARYLRRWSNTSIARRAELPDHYRDRDVEDLLNGREHRFTASQAGLVVDHVLERAEVFHLTAQWPASPQYVAALQQHKFSPAIADWLRWVSVMTLTGRVRCPVGYSEYHNTKFQGLAADGCKLALLRLWENDFDVRAFIHDSVLLQGDEAAANATAHIMTEEMRKVTPNVTIRVQITGPMARWGDEAPERTV